MDTSRRGFLAGLLATTALVALPLRLAADKSRAWFNVMDFGAVGDGRNDDIAAIQAAINAASESGGVVYFPMGTYRVPSFGSLFERGGLVMGEGA